MRLSFFALIGLITIVVGIQSCEEDRNPASYELYISVSSDKHPAISPDGSRIAYFHTCLEFPESVDYPTGLYTMDIDGSDRNLVIEGEHFCPDWSPDGRSIIFSSRGILQIINIDGDSLRTFNGIPDHPELPLYAPDWSSDGREIIFSAPLTINGGVFRVTPDFNSVKRLLLPTTNNGMYASWAPDRSRIVYGKRNKALKSVEIFISDTAQTFEQQLTNNTNDDRDVKWSPDVRKIAWSCDGKITVMDINGSNRKTLTFGQYPSWSPSSDFLVYSFVNDDFTKEVLWKININGTNKTQLTF